VDSLIFSFGSARMAWHTVALSFLVAFLASSLVAAVYRQTFQGLSWARGTMQSMVLGAIISCLLMIAIGDNVARGIGIVGSLAIIRFRTTLRDPRDLVFLFAALGVGVAAGVQSYGAAAGGSLLFSVIALAMARSPLGQQRQHDGLLRFQAPAGAGPARRIQEVMERVPRSFALVTLRDVAQGSFVDYAYQVAVRDERGRLELLEALSQVEGLRGVTYMSQTTTVDL